MHTLKNAFYNFTSSVRNRSRARLVAQCAAGVLMLGGGVAQAQNYMNVTVGGQFAPGVYGQVTFGNSAPPPVINVQPVIYGPPVYGAQVMYLHVPPGHSRNWARYCSHYNACGRPVHFVQVQQQNQWWDGRSGERQDWRNDRRDQQDRGRGEGRSEGRGDGRGEGRGEGHGRGSEHRRGD